MNFLMVFLKSFFILACASFFTLGTSSFAEDRLFTVQMNSEPISLDPSSAEDGLSYRVFAAIREGLLQYDHDSHLIPALAQSYEILDSGKKYRFHLKNTKWNDGKPVTTKDFIFAFEKTLNPKTISKLGDFLYFVENAKAYKKGEISDFSKVGVKAIDDLTLEFTLSKATPVFLHVLTMPVGYPQRESLDFTNGPFQISSWKRNQNIDLSLNPYYSSKKKPALQKIRLLILPEDMAATALFEKGELDLLTRVPHLDEQRLSKKGHLWVFPQFANYYYGFNQKNPLLKNRDNRAAIYNAVDKNEILKALLNLDRVANDWLSGFFSKKIQNSKIIVQNSGNTESLKGKKLILGFDSSTKNMLVAEILSRQLKEKLGLALELVSSDWKSHVYSLNHNTPDLFRFGWMSPFIDVYAALVCFYSTNPNNYSGWSNAKYDAILDQIAALPLSSPKRIELALKAEKILIQDDVVVLPLYHYNQRMLTSPRVKSFYVNGLGQIDFMNLLLQ